MQMELVLFTGLPILVSLPLHRLRHTGQSCNVAMCSDTLPLWLCRSVCVRVLGMCALHERRCAFPIRCAPSMSASENLFRSSCPSSFTSHVSCTAVGWDVHARRVSVAGMAIQ